MSSTGASCPDPESAGSGFESLAVYELPSGLSGRGAFPVSSHSTGTPVRIAHAMMIGRRTFLSPSALVTVFWLDPISAAISLVVSPASSRALRRRSPRVHWGMCTASVLMLSMLRQHGSVSKFGRRPACVQTTSWRKFDGMDDELLSVRQVADRLHLSPRAVLHRIKAGTLPAQKVGNGRTSAWVVRASVLGDSQVA